MMRSSALLFGVAVVVAACATGVGPELREHTYPREIVFVSRGELRTAMQALAHGVVEIDRLLAAPSPEEPALSGAVVAQLRGMQVAALGLDPGAARTNHPQLEQHLDGFLAQLRFAEAAAASQPPRYFLAGTVVGACTACHATSADYATSR